jgi:hypothetical protein
MDEEGDFFGRLLDGERILWSGRPRSGLLFGPRDVFLIPFSLFWGGFALFWEGTAIHSGAPILFRLWGVPFVLVGIYLIAGRFLVDAWARRNTLYAVTNQRVLIARSWPFRKFVAVNLDRLPEAQLSESANGRGTIRFGEPAPYWGRDGWGAWTPALDPTPQFIAIDDARSVFDQIQRAMRTR